MRGGWTFGEVNPRRINSAAWSRYASGSPERRVNPCSSLQPSGREKALQRESCRLAAHRQETVD